MIRGILLVLIEWFRLFQKNVLEQTHNDLLQKLQIYGVSSDWERI